MLTLKYPVLQSGFLDLKEAGLTKQIPDQLTFSDTILFREKNREYDNLFYSDDVSRLFEEFQSNFKVMKTFAFRERILEQAVKRFGPSISEWMAFQSDKPGFTAMHRQFLERMCSWIDATEQTPSDAAEVIRWVGLIGPDQGNNIRFNINTQFPQLNGITTVQAVQNWVLKENGYSAILAFLYVIFGKRVGHTQRTDAA